MTAGTGHRRAAEAIAQAIQVQHPQAEVECLDVLDYAPSWFRSGYSRSYLFLVRHASWVWEISYHLLDADIMFRLVQPLRRAWNLFMTRRFVQSLKTHPPALIVTTHFLPADVCRAGKHAGWLRSPAVVVVTDLHPHWFWIAPECEAMVVGTPESARVCIQRGVSAERVQVLGIPIGQSFGQPMNRAAATQALQLRPERLTALVTSGGTTVGRFRKVVESLLALETVRPHRLQLLVVCGDDDATRRYLATRANTEAMPMRVFGFINTMAELMAASDLIVAKAGGLTVSEALSRGLPLILYHVIPGQERMNAWYVAQHGAGIIARSPQAVARAVQQLLDAPQRVAAMGQAAQALSHPRAAEEIVSTVLTPLLATSVARASA